jgi:hypothetical protein
MSGKAAVDLIDFEKLSLAQKNRLKRKLQSRVKALQAQLDEVSAALEMVEGRAKQKRGKNPKRHK